MGRTFLIICAGAMLSGCVSNFFTKIQGLTMDEVREQMGEPNTILMENNHQLWTYQEDDCAQMVFFGPEGVVADHHSFGMCDKES